MSDGSDTFEQVLEQAAQRGVERLAFTNHDTTAGLTAARELGERLGVQVVGGIEVSAYDFERGRKVHILGLGIEEGAPALAALCGPTLERRHANSLWQLDRLVEAGYEVDVERALELGRASTCLYKQHLMAALTSEPYPSAGYRTLYRSLFKDGGICDRDIDYVDARDAVRVVVEDGGLAVLAHPGQLDSYDLLPDLVECGLGGIERFHPDHTLADHARCAELAVRYRLVCTSGSDYHGRFGRVPHVGFRVPAEIARDFRSARARAVACAGPPNRPGRPRCAPTAPSPRSPAPHRRGRALRPAIATSYGRGFARFGGCTPSVDALHWSP